MRLMKLVALLGLGLWIFSYSLQAQSASPTPAPVNVTTTEAQALMDALGQSEKHWWSLYMLAMAQVAAALVTLSLLFNMRSLAFLFLIFYGAIVLGTPYYIPATFQSLFGIAIVVMGVIGLLTRMMLMGRKPTSANMPVASEPEEKA